VPIQELFATLLRSLNRSSKYEYDQTVQSRKDFSFLAALEMKSFLAALEMKPWEPIRCPGPHYRYGKPRICRRCGRAFYRSVSGRCHRNIGFCSDVCAEASRRELRAFHTAATIKARSEAAAVARAGRRCAYCDEPLTAQRAAKKFCDARCRCNAHRAGRRCR